MTTDRDRVEVALRAYWGADDLDDTCSENWFREKRARMSRALAAADALAPPVPLDREAVASALRACFGCDAPVFCDDARHKPKQYRSCDCRSAFNRVLALLPAAPPPVPATVSNSSLVTPAAPPPVPEDVRRLIADIERMSSVGHISGEHGDWRGLFAGICHKARAAHALLDTPAPPADTGDMPR